jgi:asparagine synthase (glutamine-hydrolysing)
MCGIIGYLGTKHPGLLDRMIEKIRSRGPDGSGVFTDAHIELGHTRLAIVDIVGGVQPMIREDGRYVVSYNGEIYNYDDLRRRIEATGRRFTTTSDTELLPLGFAAFGPDFFAHLIGIFAFALYDTLEKRLFLVRDHFGIKPLYYAETSHGLVFGSSAAAVALHPRVDRGLDDRAIRAYLQYRYAPDGQHFYRGIRTLAPGSYLEIDAQGALRVTPFWQPRIRSGSSAWSPQEWIERTETLLEDAIALQLRSDVPVGLFLSGGVDSSMVATFAARHCPYPMTAYTFSMRDLDDEVAPARAIAQRAGARHVVIERDLSEDFSQLYDAVACMDVPVGDAIILPTYLLCAAAARDLKVVLTGEGADEIFGGYVHFTAFDKLRRLQRVLPFAHHLAPLVELLPVRLLDRGFDYQASLGILGRRKLARMISSLPAREAVYRQASSVIDDVDIVRAANLPPPPPANDMDLGLPNTMLETVRTWLPNQILNKMDQLSMAHGLEARVPFLDPRLYEHMANAPDALILNGSGNKIILRGVLKRNGGESERPKFAFHVPMEKRYKPALEKLCRQWLSADVTGKYGILKQPFIDENLAYLERGEFVASKRLVTMACLHMWLDAHGTAH